MPTFTPPVAYDNPPFPLAPGEDKTYGLDKYRNTMARGVNVYLLSDGSYAQDVGTPENSNTAIPPYPLMPDVAGTPNIISRTITPAPVASIGTVGNTTTRSLGGAVANGLTLCEITVVITPCVTKIYWGGHKNSITAAEQTALTAYTAHGVGYGADITNP